MSTAPARLSRHDHESATFVVVAHPERVLAGEHGAAPPPVRAPHLIAASHRRTRRRPLKRRLARAAGCELLSHWQTTCKSTGLLLSRHATFVPIQGGQSVVRCGAWVGQG